MIGFSIGEAAKVLKLNVPQLTAAVNRYGCPDASMRIGGKRVFTPADLAAIRRWYQARGKAVAYFDEREYETAPAGAGK